MNEDKMSNDFFNKLNEQGQHFKTSLPANGWNKLENKLDGDLKQKRTSISRIFYNAAIIFLALATTLVLSVYLIKDNFNTISESEQYALNIESLDENDNTYPVYDVHELMAAYQKLSNSQFLSE